MALRALKLIARAEVVLYDNLISAEPWYFFAQTIHPQNLYYQAVTQRRHRPEECAFMKFLGYVAYTTDAARIAQHRPAHRQYLTDLLQQGRLIAAGPFTDDSGAVFIYEAESAEGAAASLAGDPFSIHGVIVSSALKPWKLAMANADLMKV